MELPVGHRLSATPSLVLTTSVGLGGPTGASSSETTVSASARRVGAVDRWRRRRPRGTRPCDARLLVLGDVIPVDTVLRHDAARVAHHEDGQRVAEYIKR